MIEEIDVLLEKSGFDIEAYKRLRLQNQSATTRVASLLEKAICNEQRPLTSEEEAEKIRLIEEGELAAQKLEEMEEPILKALLTRGRTIQELTE